MIIAEARLLHLMLPQRLKIVAGNRLARWKYSYGSLCAAKARLPYGVDHTAGVRLKARQRAPDWLTARTMSPSPPEACWAPSLSLGNIRQGRGPSRSGGLADHSGPYDMTSRLPAVPRH